MKFVIGIIDVIVVVYCKDFFVVFCDISLVFIDGVVIFWFWCNDFVVLC